MPSPLSIPVTPDQFDGLIGCLYQAFGADIFLTNSADSDSGSCYICIQPTEQLYICPETTKAAIESFCFDRPGLTFGYLSYPFGQIIRGIPITRKTDFPLGHLKKYALVIRYSTREGKLSCTGDSALVSKISSLIDRYSAPADHEILEDSNPATIEMSLNGEEYAAAAERVIDYIREGYIYQLNLTIKYGVTCPGLNIYKLFHTLWHSHPASHYALFDSGRHKTLSTSPERFLSVSDGSVLSQPIKGTLAFNRYDDSLIHRLTENPKEQAELSMIVDMVRNDISADCAYGSVKVTGHKSTFVVDNLIQMYSNVTGQLKTDRTVIDLLLHAFPGASITGCPKLKAMELIDELEPHSRDVYCGTFFIVTDQKNMESSIAIRTGYFDTATEEFAFFAGSGIVIESDPESEYRETMAKAKKFFDIFHTK